MSVNHIYNNMKGSQPLWQHSATYPRLSKCWWDGGWRWGCSDKDDYSKGQEFTFQALFSLHSWRAFLLHSFYSCFNIHWLYPFFLELCNVLRIKRRLALMVPRANGWGRIKEVVLWERRKRQISAEEGRVEKQEGKAWILWQAARAQPWLCVPWTSASQGSPVPTASAK